MKIAKNKSIAASLIFAIIICSSTITTIFTASSFYIDYLEEMDGIEYVFNQIENGSLDGISDATWNFDLKQIKLQLNGIRNNADVISGEIFDKDKDKLYSFEKEALKQEVKDFTITRQFDLTAEGKKIGELYITITKFYIFEQLIKKAVRFFIAQGFKTFIVSLLIFLIFRHMVSRHIVTIVNQIKDRKFLDSDDKITLDRTNEKEDELSFLVEKLNHSLHLVAKISLEKDNIIKQQGDQVVQNAKLAAVGEMAGGIAHEINNPLAVIKGLAERYHRFLNDDIEYPKKKAFEDLDKIVAMTSRIHTIVRGLLYFSRENFDEVLEHSSMKKIIDSATNICGEKFKISGIDLKIIVPDDLSLQCRPVQISQIFLNLLNNCYDVLIKETDRSQKWVTIDGCIKDDLLEIRIANGGPKIADTIANQMFNPFYTTKGIGKGTGLGLSISKGIAESHHGSLSLDLSEKNTTFVLKLALAR